MEDQVYNHARYLCMLVAYVGKKPRNRDLCDLHTGHDNFTLPPLRGAPRHNRLLAILGERHKYGLHTGLDPSSFHLSSAPLRARIASWLFLENVTYVAYILDMNLPPSTLPPQHTIKTLAMIAF